MLTEAKRARIAEVMREVAADCETDAMKLDATAFNPRGVGENFGNLYAAVQAVARAVEALVAPAPAEPPDRWEATYDREHNCWTPSCPYGDLCSGCDAAGVCERAPRPAPAEPPREERDAVCVKKWPECRDGEYDPRCCRFPKSCSCTLVPAPAEPPEGQT